LRRILGSCFDYPHYILLHFRAMKKHKTASASNVMTSPVGRKTDDDETVSRELCEVIYATFMQSSPECPSSDYRVPQHRSFLGRQYGQTRQVPKIEALVGL